MSYPGPGALTATAAFALAPGAAAQPLDPSLVTELSGPVRAGASFALVLLFGAAVLVRRGEVVEAAVDTSMARPAVSLVYGCIAYALVVVLGAIALLQLGQFGVTNRVVVFVAAAAVATAVLSLAGLGYAVVGAWLTGLYGGQNQWNGLVFGASLSAFGWAVLPPVPGALVWIAVGAIGLGGPVRQWIHDERGVDVG